MSEISKIYDSYNMRQIESHQRQPRSKIQRALRRILFPYQQRMQKLHEIKTQTRQLEFVFTSRCRNQPESLPGYPYKVFFPTMRFLLERFG